MIVHDPEGEHDEAKNRINSYHERSCKSCREKIFLIGSTWFYMMKHNAFQYVALQHGTIHRLLLRSTDLEMNQKKETEFCLGWRALDDPACRPELPMEASRRKNCFFCAFCWHLIIPASRRDAFSRLNNPRFIREYPWPRILARQE